MTVYKIWTEDEIKKVVRMWESNEYSRREICTELSITPSQLSYILRRLRKNGVNMKVKHVISHSDGVIKQIKKDLINKT